MEAEAARIFILRQLLRMIQFAECLHLADLLLTWTLPLSGLPMIVLAASALTAL